MSPLHLIILPVSGWRCSLNKDCVRGKAIWRAFPVLAYAIPGFITLLAFKFMFSYGGPVNQIIVAHGGGAVGFLLPTRRSATLVSQEDNEDLTLVVSHPHTDQHLLSSGHRLCHGYPHRH